jgi:hypothetical protein
VTAKVPIWNIHHQSHPVCIKDLHANSNTTLSPWCIARQVIVSAQPGLNDIAVLDVSYGAAMQNEESKERQTVPFPGGWQGYSPAAYATGNDLGFDFFDFSPPRHPQMGTTPISEPPNSSQDPEGQPGGNSRGMTLQSPMSKSSPTPVKGKRVRTGCLTCRERHLKCDEAVPDCMNCRKRGRECKRGVRLNFLEINLYSPDTITFSEDWAGMGSRSQPEKFC